MNITGPILDIDIFTPDIDGILQNLDRGTWTVDWAMDWTMDRNVLGCMMPECTLSLHRSTPCARTVFYVNALPRTQARPFKFLLASLLAHLHIHSTSPDINMYACSPLRL